MIRKTKYLVFGVGVLTACVSSFMFSRPVQAADESLTLETYYPAPYGAYAELTTTSNTSLAIDADKRVGIGTTNPISRLTVDVRNDAVVSGTQGGIMIIGRDSPALTLYRPGILLARELGAIAGVTEAGMWADNSQPNDVVVRSRTGNLILAAGSSGPSVPPRVSIKNTGNVGIGTENPQAKLDVVGGVKIGSDISSCDSTKAGTMRYSSGVMEYCDGTAWIQVGAVTVSSEVEQAGLGSSVLGLTSDWKVCFLTAHMPYTSSGSWDASCWIATSGSNYVLTVKQTGGDGLRCRAKCIR